MWKLFALRKYTWRYNWLLLLSVSWNYIIAWNTQTCITVCKLLELDKNTWSHITVCKQMILIDKRKGKFYTNLLQLNIKNIIQN